MKDILKRCGEIFKDPWLIENAGDLLIIAGLLMIPLITFFVDIVSGFYVLSAVMIILGIIYIKSRGGE